MATVTGMTSTRMLAIEAATVVGGSIDSAGHLILAKKDGTQVDAGPYRDATTTVMGVVELATSAETQTGTDAVRAVTPAGLASIPGTKVQVINGVIAESAVNTAYPIGTSLMDASGWSLAGGYGTVVTNNISQWRCQQTFYSTAGGTGVLETWVRNYNVSSASTWTAWHRVLTMAQLDPASFTQTSPLSSYPAGESRIYYGSANSSAWDFSGKYGEVRTFVSGTDFARQIWTRHAGAVEMWVRSANAASGWTPWLVVATDSPSPWTAYTPTWTAATTAPALGNGLLVGRYSRSGRTITFHVNLTPGSTTTYGSGTYSFALPFPIASNGASFVGTAQLLTSVRWGGQAVMSSGSSTVSPFLPGSATNPQLIWMSQTAPETFANGHQLRMTGVYETTS